MLDVKLERYLECYRLEAGVTWPNWKTLEDCLKRVAS